jgi:hypothetical protein
MTIGVTVTLEMPLERALMSAGISVTLEMML